MNYFPPSPIPDWPESLPDGCISIEDAVFQFENESPGTSLASVSVQVRSNIYRNGEALPCIQCGAHTTADGETICGH